MIDFVNSLSESNAHESNTPEQNNKTRELKNANAILFSLLECIIAVLTSAIASFQSTSILRFERERIIIIGDSVDTHVPPV
jgi:hypothetical protein